VAGLCADPPGELIPLHILGFGRGAVTAVPLEGRRTEGSSGVEREERDAGGDCAVLIISLEIPCSTQIDCLEIV